MTILAKPHGFVTRGLHWVSAGLIGYGYLKGLDHVGQLSDPAVLRYEVLFALILGAVFLLRLFWTKTVAGETRLPADAPQWEHVASRGVHWSLYASVFGIVLTGLGIGLGYTVPMLGGLFLGAMLILHEGVLAVMPMLLVAHVMGAMWHKVVRRDQVLESMTGRLPV